MWKTCARPSTAVLLFLILVLATSGGTGAYGEDGGASQRQARRHGGGLLRRAREQRQKRAGAGNNATSSRGPGFFDKPDMPGGPHTGGLSAVGGGLFAPVRPYRFIDDLFPVAPEEVVANAGAMSQQVVRGTLDEKYVLTAPANVFHMDHHTDGLDMSGLLAGPEYDSPAQPLKRFLFKEGDKVSAPMDRVGEKLHKYFDQVRIKVYGAPCKAPAQEEIENSAGTTCIEGPEIAPEGICTPFCAKGFSPTEVELYCRDGGLLPPKFGCREGYLKSVEDCVFESGGSPDKASSCLEKGIPSQKLRFDTCVRDLDSFKSNCMADRNKCDECQGRMANCLEKSKQAAAGGADKKMGRAAYNVECQDLMVSANNFAKALDDAGLTGKVEKE